MPIVWTIAARGRAIRDIDENAATLGETDSDMQWPDPMALFAQFVADGFAVPLESGRAVLFRPERMPADFARDEQVWTVQVDGLHPGYARVVANLLRAPGLDVAIVASSDGGDGVALATDMPYPPGPALRRVDYEYVPPDPYTMPGGRRLELSFRRPLTPDASARLGERLQSWIDVVWRSGFALQGEAPGDCGAIPAWPYPHDPNTQAVDFEQVFLVDEACFASVLAFAERLLDERIDIAAVRVE